MDILRNDVDFDDNYGDDDDDDVEEKGEGGRGGQGKSKKTGNKIQKAAYDSFQVLRDLCMGGREEIIFYHVLKAYLDSRVTNLPPDVQAVYLQNSCKVFVTACRNIEDDGRLLQVIGLFNTQLLLFMQSVHIEVQERSTTLKSLLSNFGILDTNSMEYNNFNRSTFPSYEKQNEKQKQKGRQNESTSSKLSIEEKNNYNNNNID